MRILFLSDVYSTPLAPRRGVGNARVVHALRKHADVKVISSVPWYPAMVAKRAPHLKTLIELPATETESDGAELSHPRRLHVPRVFALQAALYAASLALPVRREVIRWQPDVLFSAWAYPDATATVALAKLLGLPSVVRVMGSDINDYAQQPYRRPQISLAMRHADRIIAVSQALADEVGALGVRQKNIAVIPTGVDTAKFYAVPREEARQTLKLPDKRLIVVPSRLSPEKGIRFFIEAFASFGEDTHAVLVGDGAEEESLRQQAQRLGLEQRIHFAGFQPEANMKLFYSAADIVCLPSLEEGWPDVLMESFACGCPVVASDIGGVSDIIALTGSGQMAPAGDVPALAEALRQGLAADWDREATISRIREHTLDRSAQRYLEACMAVAK